MILLLCFIAITSLLLAIGSLLAWSAELSWLASLSSGVLLLGILTTAWLPKSLAFALTVLGTLAVFFMLLAPEPLRNWVTDLSRLLFYNLSPALLWRRPGGLKHRLVRAARGIGLLAEVDARINLKNLKSNGLERSQSDAKVKQ